MYNDKMEKGILNFLKFLLINIFIFVLLVIILHKDKIEEYIYRTKFTEKEYENIEKTIMLFNNILTDFYCSGGDPKLIDYMPASKNVKHFIFRDIGFLREKNILLVIDMASLNIIEIKREKKTFIVKAFEEWNYIYQDFSSRKVVSEVKGLGNGFVYKLKKDGETFEIESVEYDETIKGKDQKGFLF